VALKGAGRNTDPIIVDTVDKLYDKCEKYICEKLGINNLADEEWGKGYAACRKRVRCLHHNSFSTFSRRCLVAGGGVGLILITHTEEREVKRRGGGAYDRIVPTMSNQARKVIEPLVDIWTYYMYDGEKRYLVILGDDHIAAGHRLGERFRTPEGKAIRRIDMGRSSHRAYKNLMAAFNNEYALLERMERRSRSQPRKRRHSRFLNRKPSDQHVGSSPWQKKAVDFDKSLRMALKKHLDAAKREPSPVRVSKSSTMADTKHVSRKSRWVFPATAVHR